jgi:hypothetical protein
MVRPMTLRLLGNKVRLMPVRNPARTPSGLHLIDGYTDWDIKYFHVIQTGPKVKEINPGDRVVAPLYFDAHLLPDGSKITDAGQVQLVITP